MAFSCRHLRIKHRLLPPLKTAALAITTQVRPCSTVTRARQTPNVTWTQAKYQQRQHIRFYSDLIVKHQENKEDTKPLIHFQEDVLLNESPTTLGMYLWAYILFGKIVTGK